ncbi:hypothetical protein SDC9_136180 [bioreactor metagenome]|uniref:Uncharacterized protein n=1 Tax=bioreactor metagenome TaxID=1076179 RepID=A0A645DKI1_9ZZZZ
MHDFVPFVKRRRGKNRKKEKKESGQGKRTSLKTELTPYQKERIGLTGVRWRIRDVREAHHNNADASCSGVIYGNGSIDKGGRLVGLPGEFVSGYSYNGYMQLQQGWLRR